MPEVPGGGLWGAVPGREGRPDPASVPAAAHRAPPVQGPSIEDRAREACNRHYAGGERDGWGRAPRWETVGDAERARWIEQVKEHTKR